MSADIQVTAAWIAQLSPNDGECTANGCHRPATGGGVVMIRLEGGAVFGVDICPDHLPPVMARAS